MSRTSRLMSFARENQVDDLEVTPEEIEVAQADTDLDVETVREVEVPAAEISEVTDALDTAEADQASLENTAELLETTVEDGGNGADPLALELAEAEVAKASEAYGLVMASKFSRESCATVQGRRNATISMAREAEAAASGIGKRIVEGLKALWKMLVDFVKNAFDKVARYTARAKAVLAKVKDAEFKAAGDSKVKLSVVKASGGKWPTTLETSAKSLLELAKQAKSAAANKAEFDHNFGSLAGSTMAIKSSEGSLTFEVNSYDAEGVFKTVNKGEASALLRDVIAALETVKSSEAGFKAFNDEVKATISAVKGASDDQKVLANLKTVSRAMTKVTGALVTVAGQGISLVEQSFAGKGKGVDQTSNLPAAV